MKMAQSTLGVGNKHSEHFHKEEIKVQSLEGFQKIVDSVDLDLSGFKDDMSYLGFDKERFGKMAAERLGAFRTVKLVFLAGMRGTNLEKILDKSVKVDEDVKNAFDKKLILSRGTGPNDLTMGRLIAVFPEVAAWYMLKLKTPKKLISEECHACLQFPAAAGLPMSLEVRRMHVMFSFRFSQLISGDKLFHPEFYKAAFNGQQPASRLPEKLKEICGNPKDEESRNLDIDSLLAEVLKLQPSVEKVTGKRVPFSKKGKARDDGVRIVEEVDI